MIPFVIGKRTHYEVVKLDGRVILILTVYYRCPRSIPLGHLESTLAFWIWVSLRYNGEISSVDVEPLKESVPTPTLLNLSLEQYQSPYNERYNVGYDAPLDPDSSKKRNCLRSKTLYG